MNKFYNILRDWTSLLQIVSIISLWILTFYCFFILSKVEKLTVFDPFEILGVTQSASVKEIKKAFRVLSLKLHPDKNPNDAGAAARFILINKAYEALTDEVAKSNFAKYGNPDGPGPMKIGIGLPKFLMNRNYQLGIVLVLFTILLAVIPAMFLTYFNQQKRYAGNEVLIKTMEYLSVVLKESTRVRNFSDILASTYECEECTQLKESDNADMERVIPEIVQYGKRQLRPDSTPLTLRNHYLILAHMQRLHHLLSPNLKAELNKILICTDNAVHAFIEFSLYRKWLFTATSAIEFHRCLYQALEPGANSLLQVPHFNAERVKHCLKGKRSARDLKSFMRQSNEDRKGVLDLSPDKVQDIECFIEGLPVISLTTNLKVNNESNICNGDLVSVSVLLIRENLQPRDTTGVAHTYYFPKLKKELWWIILHEKNSNAVLDFACCSQTTKTAVEKLHLWAQTGKKVYTLSVLSSVYSGLDTSIDFTVEALPSDQSANKIFVHEEDQNLDTSANLLSQVLGGQQMVNYSDEESENENSQEDDSDETSSTELDE